MKTTTIHSLITARTLFDEGMRQVGFGDRHSCSAALILLQDALELVMLTLLIEKDIDEQKALESKSFDELIGEMKKAQITVPKSGTLKALNKERVIVKHYGQLAEPVTARNYAEATEIAIHSMIQQVIGKGLREIFLSDLLEKGEAKDFLMIATKQIEEKEYLDALLSIRKAIYVEIEGEFAINKWKDIESGSDTSLGLMGALRGGWKAAYWKRNKQWIDENVRTPLDYVQVDHEQLRIDGIEWGINTAELENLLRLTPGVFREDPESEWHIGLERAFLAADATVANANYCLDRAISILLKKQQHLKSRRWLERENFAALDPADFMGLPIYEKAATSSKVVGLISSDYDYHVQSLCDGFKLGERYIYLFGALKENKLGLSPFVSGFLLQKENWQIDLAEGGGSWIFSINTDADGNRQ